jgi:hypothetical protein
MRKRTLDWDKDYLDPNTVRVLEEDLENWCDFGWRRFFYFIEHKKFTLTITLIGDSCNYSAKIRTRNGDYLEIDVASPKASTPWEEVKKYYLIHAKNTYFRHRDKLREERK